MRFSTRLHAPSPALVVAALALFVALGGAAYAVKLGKNDVKTRNIASGAVTGSRLAADAVKSAKLRDAAVTTTKIAAGAVGTSGLGDAAVERPKIKAQAVTNPKLADAAISAEKLAANSVTSASVLAAVSQTIDLGNLNLGDCVRAAVAVSSVQAGDSVIVTPPSALNAGIVLTADAEPGEIGLHACAVDFAGDPSPVSIRFLVIR